MQAAQKIVAMVRRESPMKLNFTCYIKLEREVDGRPQVIDLYFGPVVPQLILEPSVPVILAKLDERANWIQEQIANWVHQGSGWSVLGINRVYLDLAWYVQLQGGTHEKLPPKLAVREAILNIQQKTVKHSIEMLRSEGHRIYGMYVNALY